MIRLQLRRLCADERLRYEQRRVRYHLSDEALRLKPDFERKLRVLRLLDYVDEQDVPQIKAKVVFLWVNDAIECN